MIDISKMNKAEVLKNLFNASKVQGLGLLQSWAAPMTTEEAQGLLDSGQTYFDYVRGRVMKVDLSGDEVLPKLYDRDNGPGAAAAAVLTTHRQDGSESKIADTEVSKCTVMSGYTPESLAKKFHTLYEGFAPEYGYKTRDASAVPWDDVPGQNKKLMIRVCAAILAGA